MPINQRAKARDFLTRNGHGREVKGAVVIADKTHMAHPNHSGIPALAKSGQVMEGGMLATDGLLRGHVKDA